MRSTTSLLLLLLSPRLILICQQSGSAWSLGVTFFIYKRLRISIQNISIFLCWIGIQNIILLVFIIYLVHLSFILCNSRTFRCLKSFHIAILLLSCIVCLNIVLIFNITFILIFVKQFSQSFKISLLIVTTTEFLTSSVRSLPIIQILISITKLNIVVCTIINMASIFKLSNIWILIRLKFWPLARNIIICSICMIISR